jgi:uncharacterized protein (TIGR02452 family)
MDPKSMNRSRFEHGRNGRTTSVSKGQTKPNHRHGNVISADQMMAIYADTKDHFRQFHVEVQKAIHYYTNEVVESPNVHKRVVDKTEVIVQNIDTFTAAVIMIDNGLNPLVMNMASDAKPGGGVESGAQAQEENLFYRSNYFQCLPANMYRGRLGYNEAIYSPLVHILKDRYFKQMDKLVPVSCLAIPALRNPKLSTQDTVDGVAKYAHTEDYQIMQEKIESVFRIALLHGHDSMLLGALGCGAYHNPPEQVAEIFKDMVAKYDGYFKRIVFAVLTRVSTDASNLAYFKPMSNTPDMVVPVVAKPQELQAADPMAGLPDYDD